MCVSSSTRYVDIINSGIIQFLITWERAGNYYSFANAHKKDARLFFTQGCVPTENETTPSRPDAVEQEDVVSTEEVRTKGGRPRGKQKGGSKNASRA